MDLFLNGLLFKSLLTSKFEESENVQSQRVERGGSVMDSHSRHPDTEVASTSRCRVCSPSRVGVDGTTVLHSSRVIRRSERVTDSHETHFVFIMISYYY